MKWVLLFIVILAPSVLADQSGDIDAHEGPLTVAALQAELGEGFRIQETDHFAVLYDTPYETLRPLTARLEGIYDAIERFVSPLDFVRKKPGEKLNIVLFESYDRFAAQSKAAGLSGGGVAGFYDPKTHVAYFVGVLGSPSLKPLHDELQRLDSLLKTESDAASPAAIRGQIENRILALRSQRDALVETYNRVVLQHEAAHQMFFHLGVHRRGTVVPLWLAEGLACQFEVPQSDLKGSIKRINQMRLGDFRSALGANIQPNEAARLWKNAVENGKLLSVSELVVAEQFAGDMEAVAGRYAQSWALVYYLLQQQPQRMAQYLKVTAQRELGADTSPEQLLAEFESIFGKANDDFAANWVKFMIRLRYEP